MVWRKAKKEKEKETRTRLTRGGEESRRLEIPRGHYLGQRAGRSPAAGGGGDKADVYQINLLMCQI